MNLPAFKKECLSIIDAIATRSENTRSAYITDLEHWLAYCEREKFDPTPPRESIAKDRKKRVGLIDFITGWMRTMKTEPAPGPDKTPIAPKTAGRRVSTMAGIYKRMKERDPDIFNPFATVRREPGVRQEPTPLAKPGDVLKMVDACKADPTTLGRRDEALLRFLWATGARAGSVSTLTVERLQKLEDGSYDAELEGKGKKTIRALIGGQAATALERHLDASDAVRGAVFRMTNGKPMKPWNVYQAVVARAKEVGVHVSPHMFRVSFLTLGDADVESRQHAAGHADPRTTGLYDRKWRGRTAFEKMPDFEDLTKADK